MTQFQKKFNLNPILQSPAHKEVNRQELGLENIVIIVYFETEKGSEKTSIEDTHQESNIVANPGPIGVQHEIVLKWGTKIKNFTFGVNKLDIFIFIKKFWVRNI
ncbi:hypothetical protein AVEN_254153-1 [Araneus ventricosus]|uniref:Uncharacterized protein n=1 Tax=Araneus ventricosus TaxID=182803 RepID=A0A4Y2JV67_ARAVE|nr:hypothetical protein AVEN_254153-1 [Araneus ventricosus]